MRCLALRLGFAAIACVVGIAVSSVFSNMRSSRHVVQRDLVTVEDNHDLSESWPKAPAQISILEVQRSYNLSEVDITFDLQSLNGKPITSFEVWAVKSNGQTVR